MVMHDLLEELVGEVHLDDDVVARGRRRGVDALARKCGKRGENAGGNKESSQDAVPPLMSPWGVAMAVLYRTISSLSTSASFATCVHDGLVL